MKNYFHWLVENTPTVWWHDSGDIRELEFALSEKASGVTTNPPLIASALRSSGKLWKDELSEVFERKLSDCDRGVELTGVVVEHLAKRVLPLYKNGSDCCAGYVCAQVSPAMMSDADNMLSAARRYARIAPNVSVKVPATATGLEVAEKCISEGISITVTIGFSVAQVLAVGEMYEKAIIAAEKSKIKPGKCCAVVMIGRIDDYIRNIARDIDPQFAESDIRQAGIAVVKRAYEIYRQRGYRAKLCIAALRGTYHMTELAGADLIMSIHPKFQNPLLAPEIPRKECIDNPVAADVLERLSAIPEFSRAFEVEGMSHAEFLSYGATQFTISQFIESGWKRIESFKLEDCLI